MRIFQETNRVRRHGKRKAGWSVDWTEDGRRRTKHIGNKRLAERFLELKKAELLDNEFGRLQKLSWDEFVERYISEELLPSGRRGPTQTLTLQVLARFADVCRPQTVGGVDAAMIDRYRNARAKAPGKSGERLSGQTIAKELRHLRSVLNTAKRWNLLGTVPAMPQVLMDERQKRYVTERHFVDMLYHTKAANLPDKLGYEAEVWWTAFLHVAWATGLRKSQLLSLKSKGMQTDGDVAIVECQATAAGNKARRPTVHALGREAANYLAYMQREHPTDLLLPWNHCIASLDNNYFRIQKAAGIHLPCLDAERPGHRCWERCHMYCFHDFRRAHATYHYNRVDARALQRQMGHSSFTTTQRYVAYAEQQRAAYEPYVPEAAKVGEVSDRRVTAPRLTVVGA